MVASVASAVVARPDGHVEGGAHGALHVGQQVGLGERPPQVGLDAAHPLELDRDVLGKARAKGVLRAPDPPDPAPVRTLAVGCCRTRSSARMIRPGTRRQGPGRRRRSVPKPSHAAATPQAASRNVGRSSAAARYSSMRSGAASFAHASTFAGTARSTEPPPTKGSMYRPVSAGAPAAMAGSSCDLPPGHFRNGVSSGCAARRCCVTSKRWDVAHPASRGPRPGFGPSPLSPGARSCTRCTLRRSRPPGTACAGLEGPSNRRTVHPMHTPAVETTLARRARGS